MVRRNGPTTATKTDRCIRLGNQQRHKVDSYLLQLLIHLLLYQYRPMSSLPAKFWQIFSKNPLTNPRP
ncbi:unknown protein [Microcystis aeruginosa NIES-843]|uniref:Uncharacterized protein n=1 Tax=Microcystis aeruginosa (strain NIES-843 / IAM M-2473) TaxID=449447 RepID=B0JXP8_MICAN|nr:unknown protein [Microcystis aeruginosa NIES-843]